MRLSDALHLDPLCHAGVVAGAGGLDRTLRWVHIVDLPDPVPWVRPSQLLLTTGIHWPVDADAQRILIRRLDSCQLAGIALAVPNYLTGFPPVSRAEAARVGLPLLEVPWEIPFAQITEEINGALLAEAQQINLKSEAIHRELMRAATETTDLDDLIQTFARLIDRTVAIEDAQGHILSVSDETAAGAFDECTVERLEGRGLDAGVRNATRPLRIPALPDEGVTARLACPVRMSNQLVAVVWILEGETRLNDLDVRAAELAAAVAALHLAHEQALASLETRLGYSLFDTLLEGRFTDDAQGLERAARRGFDPTSRYRVGLLVMDEAVPLSRTGFLRREQLAARVDRRLRELGEMPLVSVSLNQVVFLVQAKSDLGWLAELTRDAALAVALGRSHDGIPGIRQSYLEARKLLGLLQPGQMLRYDDLIVPRVLQGDTDAQQDLLHALFGRLFRHRNGDVLIQTLLAYARNGYQQHKTAESLHIHPKTLRYRLGRAAALTALDFADAETRFRLQLAARLVDHLPWATSA